MRRSRHICRNWCRRSRKITALQSICLNVGKETMYTVLCQPLRNYHNCDREIPEGDLRQEAFRTFSGNKKPALERGAVEPFLLCGNGRICIGRKYPQVYRTSEQSLLIRWRRGNAAVKENIHKGQPGICEPHRAYVLCSIQALECL